MTSPPLVNIYTCQIHTVSGIDSFFRKANCIVIIHLQEILSCSSNNLPFPSERVLYAEFLYEHNAIPKSRKNS